MIGCVAKMVISAPRNTKTTDEDSMNHGDVSLWGAQQGSSMLGRLLDRALYIIERSPGIGGMIAVVRHVIQ